ncbi:MAG TPA: sulfurtransferase [Steroidobacteraceae bacterium]|jgi:thiosulfate/3-mercaptopyruvate sulfurtransferase
MLRDLVEPLELSSLIQRGSLAVVDCRFDLTRPQWGAEAYAAGHIPTAVYANLDLDLSSPVSAQSGRHPLPSPEALAATLGRLGIDLNTPVVAYDQGNGALAARLWWLARWVGHRQVAVLDGGFAAWQQEGLPVSAEPTVPATKHFDARPDSTKVVSTQALSKMLAAGDFQAGRLRLVDARAADRFAGENETLDPVSGHVPGARNHPFAGNVDDRGRFLAAAQLRNRWRETLGTIPPSNLISMCGSGVTACHNLLALELAGLPGARLYAGSWSEWIRDPARAVATGPG